MNGISVFCGLIGVGGIDCSVGFNVVGDFDSCVNSGVVELICVGITVHSGTGAYSVGGTKVGASVRSGNVNSGVNCVGFDAIGGCDFSEGVDSVGSGAVKLVTGSIGIINEGEEFVGNTTVVGAIVGNAIVVGAWVSTSTGTGVGAIVSGSEAPVGVCMGGIEGESSGVVIEADSGVNKALVTRVCVGNGLFNHVLGRTLGAIVSSMGVVKGMGANVADFDSNGSSVVAKASGIVGT